MSRITNKHYYIGLFDRDQQGRHLRVAGGAVTPHTSPGKRKKKKEKRKQKKEEEKKNKKKERREL